MFVYLQNMPTVSILTSYLQLRQKTTRFPEWAIFYWSHRWKRYTTGICTGSTSILHLFINDLPLNITNDSVVCDLFADDNSFHSCGSDLQLVQTFLQEGLNDVSKWCNQNRMVIPPHKTKCMVLTSRQKHQRRPLTFNLTLEKGPVQQVRKHRVLGVMILVKS